MSQLNKLDSELHRIINLPIEVTEDNGYYNASIDLYPGLNFGVQITEGDFNCELVIQRAKDFAYKYAHYEVRSYK